MQPHHPIHPIHLQVVALALTAINAHESIVEDWRLEGTTLTARQNLRLVAPIASIPDPILIAKDVRRLNHGQAVALGRALTAAAVDGLLSNDTLAEALTRLASELPEYWEGPAADGFRNICAELDPTDSGFVLLTSAIDYFIAEHL